MESFGIIMNLHLMTMIVHDSEFFWIEKLVLYATVNGR